MSKDAKALENLKKDLEAVQEENQFLNFELTSAKEQITELEKSLLAANENHRIEELMDKINYLEKSLKSLSKETYELREQNELLEFRNIELEETHDKV